MTHENDPDLDAIARLREGVAPPSAAVLAAARERLGDQDVRPAVLALRRRPARPARRRVLVGLGAASVVAAVAAGSYALTDDRPAPRADGGQPPVTSAGTSPAPPRVVRFVNAGQVLDAAATAAHRDASALAPGEYRHVSSHYYSVTTIEEPPHRGAYELTENRSDTWTPASGTGYQRNDNNLAVRYPTAEQRRFAAQSPGGIPKRELTWYEVVGTTYTQVYPTYERGPALLPCEDCPDDSVWDNPDSASPSAFPADAATLRSSLYAWARKQYAELVKYGKGDQFTVDDLAYDASTRVASRADVPGTLRATVYQVIKAIPGIRLIGSLANYDGTTGIAVGRVDTFHVEHDLIFTANGSTYIGDRTIARKPSRQFHVASNTLLGASAVTVTITSKPTVPARPR